MFKNTNDFFDLVREGNVSQIDIQEFIYKKTKKHKKDKLITFLNDIEFYLFVEKENLLTEITPEMWEEKHNYYEAKGEKIPFKEVDNLLKKLKEKKGIDNSNEPDKIRYYCKEELFFPYEFFCIYQLRTYVKNLIQKTQENPKHENIFSNNGFVLFEHILNEYVKPIGKRGRLSDIHFFYWSMHNNKPQLIHQRPERFKEWFFENYNEENLGKIKTLKEVEDPDRKKHYSNALDWFKTQPF